MDLICENLDHEGFGPGEILSGNQYLDLDVSIVVTNFYMYAIKFFCLN